MDIKQRLRLFANELNYIQDVDTRTFAAVLIAYAPEYFFTAPASSSEKYHPYFARETGGLVKHTRCVAFFAKQLATCCMLEPFMADMLITAAIAHDIRKQGVEDQGIHTKWEHPELAHDYILQMWEKNDWIIDEDKAKTIAKAVLSHMGQWAHYTKFTKNKKQYPLPEKGLEEYLHIADYMASRSEITGFKFENVDGVEIELNDTMNFIYFGKDGKDEPETTEPVEETADTIGNTVTPFGKHRGLTICELYQNHRDYLDWVMKQEKFTNQEYKAQVVKYMSLIKG